MTLTRLFQATKKRTGPLRARFERRGGETPGDAGSSLSRRGARRRRSGSSGPRRPRYARGVSGNGARGRACAFGCLSSECDFTYVHDCVCIHNEGFCSKKKLSCTEGNYCVTECAYDTCVPLVFHCGETQQRALGVDLPNEARGNGCFRFYLRTSISASWPSRPVRAIRLRARHARARAFGDLDVVPPRRRDGRPSMAGRRRGSRERRGPPRIGRPRARSRRRR